MSSFDRAIGCGSPPHYDRDGPSAWVLGEHLAPPTRCPRRRGPDHWCARPGLTPSLAGRMATASGEISAGRPHAAVRFGRSAPVARDRGVRATSPASPSSAWSRSPEPPLPATAVGAAQPPPGRSRHHPALAPQSRGQEVELLQPTGRPPINDVVAALVVRMARENRDGDTAGSRANCSNWFFALNLGAGDGARDDTPAEGGWVKGLGPSRSLVLRIEPGSG
jgi:hypothetical protein